MLCDWIHWVMIDLLLGLRHHLVVVLHWSIALDSMARCSSIALRLHLELLWLWVLLLLQACSMFHNLIGISRGRSK